MSLYKTQEIRARKPFSYNNKIKLMTLKTIIDSGLINLRDC